MGLLTTKQEHRAPAQALAAAPTLRVEEELLLLDPATGQAVPAAPELLARLGGARWAKAELMRFQFEAVTDVCTSLSQLRAQLAATERPPPTSPKASAACWRPRAPHPTAPPAPPT
jgi:carboxylate-amine ligase